MSINYSDNNHISLSGKIVKEKSFSHEIYGEKFYIFSIEVLRLSSSVDIIPVTISERLIANFDLSLGKVVEINGQFRSYNGFENEKSKLILTVFAKDIAEKEEQTETKIDMANKVTLAGFVCKKPIYRKTPFGREIADVLIAVNRAYNKSDYIPCIAWGRNARFCENMEVGKQIKIFGRVQSREYEKKFEDGTISKRVAYEVSISGMELIEENVENIEESSKPEEAV